MFDIRASLGSTRKLIREPSKEKGCVVSFSRPASSFIRTCTIRKSYESFVMWNILRGDHCSVADVLTFVNNMGLSILCCLDFIQYIKTRTQSLLSAEAYLLRQISQIKLIPVVGTGADQLPEICFKNTERWIKYSIIHYHQNT
jgi:hypothetical protein